MRSRVLVWIVAITAVWVALWDRFTSANIAGGALVAVALLVVFPLPRVDDDDRLRFHPLAQLRLLGVIAVDLVRSNLAMAKVIVSPRATVRPSVVHCPMVTDSPTLMSLIATIVALSPGMMVIEATGPRTLAVHALNADDATVRGRVARLERLVVAAFGSAADRRLCEGAVR